MSPGGRANLLKALTVPRGQALYQAHVPRCNSPLPSQSSSSSSSPVAPAWDADAFLLENASFFHKLLAALPTKLHFRSGENETCDFPGKVPASKSVACNELFTRREERLAKSTPQPTLAWEQLEADETQSSEDPEEQRCRASLAGSCRGDAQAQRKAAAPQEDAREQG